LHQLEYAGTIPLYKHALAENWMFLHREDLARPLFVELHTLLQDRSDLSDIKVKVAARMRELSLNRIPEALRYAN